MDSSSRSSSSNSWPRLLFNEAASLQAYPYIL